MVPLSLNRDDGETQMKSVLLALAAVSTLAAAGSAAAQPYRGDNYRGDNYRGDNYRSDDYRGQPDRGYGRGEGQRLEMRIQRAADRGALSWREARFLRAEVDAVQRLEWRYSRDGLSRWEANDVARRYDTIRARIRWERSDGDGVPGQRYGSGYGGGGWR